MATGYNPFDKPVDDLVAEDLSVLRDVSEGWYIEYKSDSRKPIDIAKSLTSFVNQYGGYLFFGIQQSRDATRTAGAFPGIPDNEIGMLRDRIRDGASQHSQPDVPYTEKVISGPSPEIGLDKGSSIIVIDIPEGLQTPYVHSSGRIYRRIGDSSAPKIEADRYLLDELWKRRDSNREQLRTFIAQRDPATRNQGIQGWFHLYVFPDPSQANRSELLTIEAVADVFLKDRIGRKAMAVPMDSVYSSGLGVCARQIGSASADILGLTAEIRIRGAASFCVPINVCEAGYLASRGYESEQEFRSLLHRSGHHQMLVADFSDLALAIIGLLNQLLMLKDSLNDARDLLAGFSIQGTRGTIPYLDSNAYIRRVKEYGFPTSHIDMHEYPSANADIDELIKLKYMEIDESANSSENAQVRCVKFSFPLLNFVFAYAGVTTGLTDFDIRDLRLDRYPGQAGGKT